MISDLSKFLFLTSIVCFNTAPGVPYQVVVVAFTSDGKEAQNDLKTLLS